MLSSPVMTFKRSVGWFITVSFSSWQIATRLSFWSWVKTLGTNFAAIRCKFSCCQNSLTRYLTNSNLCTEIVYGTTTILVDSRPYLFHFWGVCCRAWPTWSIIISSRSSTILETSKPLKVRLRLMHESPKACFNISEVSLPVLPNLTQNLMHTICSSTSAIPPISENRRRLMQ